MELFEYIKSQLPQMPNSAIMKQLGASQELIDYVKETPENTNFAIAEVIEGSGGGGDAEVWLVGDTYEDVEGVREFTLSNSGDVDHMTELFTNSSNYEVYLNGELLPYVTTIVEPAGVSWCDTEIPEHATKRVDVLGESSVATEAYADYMDATTAPTSVEVSVKHK